MALRRQKTRSPGLVASGDSDMEVEDESIFVDDTVTGTAAPAEGDAPTSPAEVEDRPLLGEVLARNELITGEQLASALDTQKTSGQRLGEVLIEAEVLNELALTTALAAQFGLREASLARAGVDPVAVAMLDEAIARDLQAVPLSRSATTVHLAVADPARPNLVVDLEEAVGSPVVLTVASLTDVEMAIDRAYQASSAVTDAVRVFEARAGERATGPAVGTQEVDATAPIVQVVTTILTQAVRDGASDVHIEPMGDRVRVRNRVDGALHEVLSLPMAMAQALVSRIKIMADMNIVERRRPQDGQIETVIDDRELDIRVSTTSTVHGEKTVLRLLDKSRALFDVGTLGMSADTAAIYGDIIRSPYGMVVCAGPTGSGKTTTLYASLMAINSDEINVMTVEDPVEYTFSTINQIGIHEQAGVTFAAGLRSILRQDPDAILVGEIRDVETARIAIQAALTGHFVLSTIHATDATSALHRFLDMGIESFLLASSMLAVVGQRLIRRNCTECLVPFEPPAENLSFYERAGGKPKDTFMHGEGCAVCSNTGYSGRIGVYEILKVTNEMRDLVVRNSPVDEIRKLAIDQGMIPMRDQALRLVADDVTTIAEVMRTIYIL